MAIVVFFNAFNFDSLCPEDGRSTTMIDGEEVITCNNDDRMLWEQQWVKQVFYACCLIVPGSLLLTVTGYNLRKKKSRFGTLSSELEANNPPDSLSETKVVKALQAAAMFFGIGISSIVAIIGIALLVLFIVFISAFFSR